MKTEQEQLRNEIKEALKLIDQLEEFSKDKQRNDQQITIDDPVQLIGALKARLFANIIWYIEYQFDDISFDEIRNNVNVLLNIYDYYRENNPIMAHQLSPETEERLKGFI